MAVDTVGVPEKLPLRTKASPVMAWVSAVGLTVLSVNWRVILFAAVVTETTKSSGRPEYVNPEGVLYVTVAAEPLAPKMHARIKERVILFKFYPKLTAELESKLTVVVTTGLYVQRYSVKITALMMVLWPFDNVRVYSRVDDFGQKHCFYEV